ncbi:MAG TPA: T9SS type A sorting domain-containing protein [Bacteroidia bacterium]|nr:T9SS type A sorting domain-containing protein [Bacteroidia bacterium]
MKKLYILFLITATFANAQQINFTKTYFPGLYADVRGIAQTPDCGFLVAGLDKTSTDTVGDMYVMKIDANGNSQWKKYYGLPKEDGGNDIILCNDGGFIVSGHTNNLGDECDMYLIRGDVTGNTIWSKQLGGFYDDIAITSIEIPDGNFITLGNTENYGATNLDFMLARMDKNGNEIFVKTIGTEKRDFAKCMIRTSDNSLILGGSSYNNSTMEYSMTLIKCDLNGNILWTNNNYNSLESNGIYSILESPQHNLYCIGRKYSADNGMQGYVACLNLNGDVIWEKEFGSKLYDAFTDACILASGSIYCVGETCNFGDEQGDIMVVKMDYLGNFTAPHLYGTKNIKDEARTVVVCSDGGLVIGGQSNITAGTYEALVIKTGVWASGINDFTFSNSAVYAYPNPFSDKVNFSTYYDASSTKELKIFDAKGQVVCSHLFSQPFLKLELNMLQNGVYYYQVSDKGAILKSERMIKQ